MAILFPSSFIPPNIHLRNTSPSTINPNPSHHHINIIVTAKSSSATFPHHTSNQTIQKPLILQSFLNSLDNFICQFIDSPLDPTLDPAQVLSGNFAPVDELPPTACTAVEGVLPRCLHGGVYIRNGPNPQFIPKGPYHFFEGDGMLHMIKISDGEKPTFCCRYVKTHKHEVEREMGHPFVPSIFSSFNGGLFASVLRTLLTAARVISGHFDPFNHGFGAANTSLGLFSGRLFALCESDLPYALNITEEGDITTVGRHDFGATEPFLRMTAHPKVDRLTGEAFAYEYDSTPPFFKYFRIDADGRKQKCVPISSMERVIALHDFAVTENYAVIPDVQMVVNPVSILRGRSPVEIDEDKVARVGIIPRYAEDEAELVWVEAAGFNPLHCVNAWEEDGGDTVCVVASNALRVEKLFENIGRAQLKMELLRVNLKTKKVQRLSLSPDLLDFGTINPAHAAKKSRYLYAILLGETKAMGIVKLDLSLLNGEEGGSDCTVARRRYGPGCHVCEPYFVAREPDNPAAEEDDGYLVAYVHDENSNETKFVVMDAKSPTLEVIAAIQLPQRIPLGFHGLFLSETDLNNLITN